MVIKQIIAVTADATARTTIGGSVGESAGIVGAPVGTGITAVSARAFVAGIYSVAAGNCNSHAGTGNWPAGTGITNVSNNARPAGSDHTHAGSEKATAGTNKSEYRPACAPGITSIIIFPAFSLALSAYLLPYNTCFSAAETIIYD